MWCVCCVLSGVYSVLDGVCCVLCCVCVVFCVLSVFFMLSVLFVCVLCGMSCVGLLYSMYIWVGVYGFISLNLYIVVIDL